MTRPTWKPHKRRCEYSKHSVPEMDICIFTDAKNGVANDTPTCRTCYNKHILAHYPNGKMAQWIRRQVTA